MAVSKPTALKRIPKVRIVAVGDRCLQLRYRDPDSKKEIRIGTGTRDPVEAELVKRELESKLRLGIPTKIAVQDAVPDTLSWEEFRQRYSDHIAVALRSKSQIDAESRLDLCERILKPKQLREVASREALDRLQAQLLQGAASRFERPRSSSTVRYHMRSILAALNWARRKGYLQAVPDIQLISLEENDHMKGRPLVGEEIDRLLAAVPKVVGEQAAASWDYLLRGILASGLRLAELMALSWDQPQTIRPIWRRGALPVLSFPAQLQKNKRFQEIPLCPWMEQLLEETPPELRTGWVFNPQSIKRREGWRRRLRRLSTQHVGKAISRIGKQAGIIVDEGNARTGAPLKYASAHDLRRTFAIRLRNAELPTELIRKLMRHADLKTTERYYLTDDIQHDAGRLRSILKGNVWQDPVGVGNEQ